MEESQRREIKLYDYGETRRDIGVGGLNREGT